MRRRRTVGALAAVLALALASSAQASSIVYVCGPNLCRIDPTERRALDELSDGMEEAQADASELPPSAREPRA